MYKLISHSTNNEFPLYQELVTIGTSEDNDVIIYGESFENYQVQITRDRIKQTYSLHVLENNPPTLLNGSEVSTAIQLNSGDEIFVGKELIFSVFEIASEEDDEQSKSIASEPSSSSYELVSTVADSNIQNDISERIGCAYCFRTIDSLVEESSDYNAFITLEGKYYHPTCLTQIKEPPQASEIKLPPPLPLPSLLLNPLMISTEVANSLSDKPLGISESRLYLHEVEIQKFIVANNDLTALNIQLKSAPPWLHLEFSPETYYDGQDILRPREEIDVTVQPHPIRPSHYRYRLFLTPERFLIVYSNGANVLVWGALFFLVVLWLIFWFSFTSIDNLINNFNLLLDVNPQQIFIQSLRFYIQSAVLIGYVFLIMPTKVLSFTRNVLNSLKKVPVIAKPAGYFFEIVQNWLVMPNRLSFKKDNLFRIIGSAMGFGLGAAIPWLILAYIIIFFFTSLLPVVGLFFFVCFVGSVYLFYLFFRSYDLIASLNINNRINKIQAEATK